MKELKAIYVAGKMQDDDWRQKFFDKVEGVAYCVHDDNDPLVIPEADPWPGNSQLMVCGLHYTGPFFVDTIGGHGFQFWEDDAHGGNARPNYSRHISAQREDLDRQRKEVQQWCFEAIKNADLLFAWIDCIDCYGTIAEIGYAKALGKLIWIAGSRRYDDLWFVYAMAHEVVFANEVVRGTIPSTIFQNLLDEYRRIHPHFDSPIEESFWEAWLSTIHYDFFELTPQYPIGRYRVDFAHALTKTAIELDGHATHSSPDAIAYDRQRQRYIESEGWHVIRFGGKEIYANASACAKEVGEILKRRPNIRRT